MTNYTWQDFGPGKSGDQIREYRERLDAHDVPPVWTEEDEERTRIWQERQGWTGADADGLPGPVTLARLFAPAPGEVEEPEPAPSVFPADILGPGWKITTPELDDDGEAKEIRQPALADYSSEWFHLTDDERSAVFEAVHGGATTPTSKNTRSEAREMTPDGSDEIEWDGRRGRHRLDNVVLSVDDLTNVKPHEVVMQIHNGEKDVATWRVEGIKGTDRAKVWIAEGNDSHAFPVGEIDLREKFRPTFDVFDGLIHFDFNGKRLPFTVAATDDCFFKLGNYLQSNPETAPDEIAGARSAVSLHSTPKVSHS